jgi:hypothetical protein
MSKKYIAIYAVVPVVALGLAVGALASAQGLGGRGMGGFMGFGSNETPDQYASRMQTMFSNESQILGISVDTLKSDWAQGMTLSQIAQQQGIDQNTLQSKINDYRKQQMQTKLQALVSQGVITQDQANQRLQFVQNNHQSTNGTGSWHSMRGMKEMMRTRAQQTTGGA